jgi:hypothetical protein
MSDFDLDDIQFVGNTSKEANEERRKVAAELARLQAIEAAARDLFPTIGWWSDGYDDAVVYRCVGCDVERDDVQNGTDTHHESCRVGKLIAALDAK